MKTLNELTPKERIELYKKALVDWMERPKDSRTHTDWGMCWYFENEHEISTYHNLSLEWKFHVLDSFKINALWGDPIPRIAALNAMIKELEEMV